MSDVIVEIKDGVVTKYNTSIRGYRRLKREAEVYHALESSVHIPRVLSIRDTKQKIKLVMEEVAGQSAAQWIDLQEDWTCLAQPWEKVKEFFFMYCKAEMDFLSHDVLYRDLNLSHLIVSSQGLVMIDLEASIIKQNDGVEWRLDDTRGTYETMAPEEFRGYGKLSSRAATYRVAVVAYLLLTGSLPFARASSRRKSRILRRQYTPLVSSELSSNVRSIFRVALAQEPARRYGNPDRFLSVLVAANHGR